MDFTDNANAFEAAQGDAPIMAKTLAERIQEAKDHLYDLASNHGNGGRFRWYGSPRVKAEGEFCGAKHEFAIVRLKGAIREFALATAPLCDVWPTKGAKVKIENGKMEVAKRDVLCLRPGRCSNVYPVVKNKALIAKAVEMGRGFDLCISQMDNSSLAPCQALAEMERANSYASARSRKIWSFEAYFYAANGNDGSRWRISSYGGSMEFSAPSPEELVEMINTQNACEKERRAINRVGRRIKDVPALEAPARRVARL